MTDLPVVVLFGRTLQDSTFEDSPLHLVEAGLDVLLLEGLRRFETLSLTQELEVLSVKPLDVVRIDGVLHDLQPIARQGGIAAVFDSVHDEDVEAWELGCGIGTDVHPHHAAHNFGFSCLLPDTIAEVLVVGFGRLFQAGAVKVPFPAVISAANAVFVDHAVGQGSASMRTGLGDDSVPPTLRGFEQGPVFSEEADGLGEYVVEILLEGDRVPVAAQQLTHRCAWPYPSQLFVLFDCQHGSSSISRVRVVPQCEPTRHARQQDTPAERNLWLGGDR